LTSSFVQVLEDMINDLSNSPEPIQILNFFSNDTTLLHDLGPKVQAAISADTGGSSILRNGVDNTLSGPATTFQVDPGLASRLGFTVQGGGRRRNLAARWSAFDRSGDCGRPTLYGPRAPVRRTPLLVERDPEHRLQLCDGTHCDAGVRFAEIKRAASAE